MNKITKTFFIVSAILLSVAFARPVSAAVIYMLPETGSFNRGDQVTVDVKIDSEGKGINAAQATVSWPANILEFVEASKDGSAFNFWIEDPKLSSSSDSFNFIGGTAKGISGGALQILKVKFMAKESGVANITFSDVAITASDGRGTDVLSQIKGGSYRVGVQVTQPELPKVEPSAPIQAPVPQPVVVERKAIVAEKVPVKPGLRVPLYSDQTRWYNNLGDLVVLWDVPDDVTSVATALNHSPNTVPSSVEKELATGKKFGILEEGVWYVHVRFKNNIGWGPVVHWRIAIDLTPPLAFEIKLPEGESTDNPAPVFQFRTSDELSDLKEYQVRIDENEAINLLPAEFKGSFTLPLQEPGEHRVVVKAVDIAENSVEDFVMLTILPIPSPAFTLVTKDVFSNEAGGLSVQGTALPGMNVLLEVQQVLKGGKGETVAKTVVVVDDRGNWSFSFREPLKNGQYVVTARSQDTRGALSLRVESFAIQVKSKPIIQLGAFQLGMNGAALFLLVVLVAGFGGGVLFYKKRQEKLALRVSFAGLETAKIFKIIMEDVDRLSEAFKTPTTGDDEPTLKRLQENIKKMEGYLTKGIGKIKG